MFENVEAFYRPESVPEALRLIERSRGETRVLAGGAADLAVEGGRAVRFLIDLTSAGLSYIRKRETLCRIGAATTLADLAESTAIRALAGGMLSRAAAASGPVQIRNQATLGGNLGHGAAADLTVPLLALDAVAVLATMQERRRMPLADYLVALRRGALRNSLLIEVSIPEPPSGARCGWSFQKFGRTEIDISVVNAAAGVQLDARGRVKWARLAVGGASEAPFRLLGVEELMSGCEFDQVLLAKAGEAVAREVKPISDLRASAEFRRELSRVLAGRALEASAAEAGRRV